MLRKPLPLHYALQDGMDLIFKEGNPAGIKAWLEAVGLGTAVVRLPLVEATATLEKDHKELFKHLVKDSCIVKFRYLTIRILCPQS